MTTKSRGVLPPRDLTPLLDPIPRRLEVEIGCGNGHFITANASQHISTRFVGVDLKMERCLKTLKKVGAAQLGNVDVVCGRAEEVLATLCARTVDAFHIYFPDPWPKSRHRRRRFLRRLALDDLTARLKPQGRIYFVTDFFDYSVQAKVLMLLNERLSVIDETPPREALISVFGQRSVEWGRDIHFVTGSRMG